jgi:hypothetical protein
LIQINNGCAELGDAAAAALVATFGVKRQNVGAKLQDRPLSARYPPSECSSI